MTIRLPPMTSALYYLPLGILVSLAVCGWVLMKGAR